MAAEDQVTIAALTQENARLKMRTQATEVALYQVRDQLAAFVEHLTKVVQAVHAVNEKFPIGDNTPEGVHRLVINAIRASTPGDAALSDAEIAVKYKLVRGNEPKS